MKWKDLLQLNNNNNLYDHNTAFEDYQKIIQSVNFRRLQDKTQVFPLDKSDFIRTRLTHSIEVSSNGRILAEMVANKIIEMKLDDKFDYSYKEYICNILQSAGLIHDIGNPPFGHFGEVAIKSWFKDYFDKTEFNGNKLSDIFDDQMINDFCMFDGNAQGLRILTKLNSNSFTMDSDFSMPLIATMIKYPVSSNESDSDSPNILKHKTGYFKSDKDAFDNIESSLKLNGKRHPLTFLLEAADDISYSTADIEDGFKKGFIKTNDLNIELQKFASNNPDVIKEFDLYKVYVMELNDAEILGYSNPEEVALEILMNDSRKYFLKSACNSFITNYKDIMSGKYNKELLSDIPASKYLNFLKSLGFKYIFDTPFIYKMEVRGWHVYEFLLKKLCRALLYYDTDFQADKLSPIDHKIITMIDDEYIRKYHSESNNADDIYCLYLRLRLAVDFVSSMTDSKALNMYQELSGIKE